MSKKPTKKKCALCGTGLVPAPYEGLWLHPTTPACQVAVVDSLGLSLDDQFEVADGEIYALAEAPTAASSSVSDDFAGGIVYDVDGGELITPGAGTSIFLGADAALRAMFEAAGQSFLGGSSGPRGWSSVSTFQRCRYLWRTEYGGKPIHDERAPRGEALEVGTLVHAFTGLHYMRRIDPAYPITPEQCERYLRTAGVTPAYLAFAWSLFESYVGWWGDESWMIPLAVEELVVDPRTGFSCRWDLVFRIDAPYEGLFPGVYVCNTKTSGQNGRVEHEQWKNDGQIIGEVDLYDRVGYHRRWGALRGACINMIVKTKVPQYTREWIYPPKHILKDHHRSLGIWSAEMAVAAATGSYPRSRASCVTRFHTLCQLHDHCAGGGDE